MRMAGIDVGQRRIGIAVSDPSGTIATPARTLERGRSDEDAVASICAALDELGWDVPIAAVVVGLPRRLDGTANAQTGHARRMIALLERRLAVPVIPQDERLTSIEAESRLAAQERDWRKRKARIDAVAAAIILQDYLDARTRTSAVEGYE